MRAELPPEFLTCHTALQPLLVRINHRQAQASCLEHWVCGTPSRRSLTQCFLTSAAEQDFHKEACLAPPLIVAVALVPTHYHHAPLYVHIVSLPSKLYRPPWPSAFPCRLTPRWRNRYHHHHYPYHLITRALRINLRKNCGSSNDWVHDTAAKIRTAHLGWFRVVFSPSGGIQPPPGRRI